MIAKELTEENINYQLPQAEPITILHIIEAIRNLMPESASDKITFSCEEEGAICVSLAALAEFTKALIREMLSTKTESIRITSGCGFFYVSVIGRDAFCKSDNLIKYARPVGFSVDISGNEIIFSLPISADSWMNLYTKNRNKLLSLLRTDDF